MTNYVVGRFGANEMEYKLEYCDGFYITQNGKGVIDFAENVDSEFANFVLSRLKQRPTKRAADSAKAARLARKNKSKSKKVAPAKGG